jgi:acylphosphatase
MDTVVFHLSIRGTVQSVGYRWNMVQQARRLGVSGWVRNRADGSVEALVAGQAQAVDALVAWARQGPPGGRVGSVDVAPASGHFDGFEQHPTL